MFQFLIEVWRSLTDPDRLIQLLTAVITGWWGYALLAGIVFAESGLLVGLFLPGDSLLFTVGVVAGAGQLDIVQICALFVVFSILGDQSGYLLGRRAGPRIFTRPDSTFFKQEYIKQTHEFYEKHGGKTLIYAKFVPIVRTFAPFMAGVGRMVVANAASEAELRASLAEPPDHPERSWDVKQLLDFNQVITDFLKSIKTG